MFEYEAKLNYDHCEKSSDVISWDFTRDHSWSLEYRWQEIKELAWWVMVYVRKTDDELLAEMKEPRGLFSFPRIQSPLTELHFCSENCKIEGMKEFDIEQDRVSYEDKLGPKKPPTEEEMAELVKRWLGEEE